MDTVRYSASGSASWTLCDNVEWAQDSDFLYLTGIDQQAVAVIEASSPMRESSFTLYLPDSDAQVQLLSLSYDYLSQTLRRRTCVGMYTPRKSEVQYLGGAERQRACLTASYRSVCGHRMPHGMAPR